MNTTPRNKKTNNQPKKQLKKAWEIARFKLERGIFKGPLRYWYRYPVRKKIRNLDNGIIKRRKKVIEAIEELINSRRKLEKAIIGEWIGSLPFLYNKEEYNTQIVELRMKVYEELKSGVKKKIKVDLNKLKEDIIRGVREGDAKNKVLKMLGNLYRKEVEEELKRREKKKIKKLLKKVEINIRENNIKRIKQHVDFLHAYLLDLYMKKLIQFRNSNDKKKEKLKKEMKGIEDELLSNFALKYLLDNYMYYSKNKSKEIKNKSKREFSKYLKKEVREEETIKERSTGSIISELWARVMNSYILRSIIFGFVIPYLIVGASYFIFLKKSIENLTNFQKKKIEQLEEKSERSLVIESERVGDYFKRNHRILNISKEEAEEICNGLNIKGRERELIVKAYEIANREKDNIKIKEVMRNYAESLLLLKLAEEASHGKQLEQIKEYKELIVKNLERLIEIYKSRVGVEIFFNLSYGKMISPAIIVNVGDGEYIDKILKRIDKTKLPEKIKQRLKNYVRDKVGRTEGGMEKAIESQRYVNEALSKDPKKIQLIVVDGKLHVVDIVERKPNDEPTKSVPSKSNKGKDAEGGLSGEIFKD